MARHSADQLPRHADGITPLQPQEPARVQRPASPARLFYRMTGTEARLGGGRLTLQGCPRVQGSPVGRTLDVQVPPLERNPRAPAPRCSSSLEPKPRPLRVPRRRVRHRHRSVVRRPHGLLRPAALPRASSRARSVAGCGPCSPHEPAAGTGLGVTPGYTCPRLPLPDVAMRGRLGQQGIGSARCPRRPDLLV